MSGYDCIVIGTGGLGSAALEQLARRGARVLGLDRFPPGHARGSSHGSTRMIRRAYFEHPSYVPLVERAYGAWKALSDRCGRRLLVTCGLVQVGPGDGPVLSGVRASARQHGLAIEELTAVEVERRMPGLRVPVSSRGIVEPGAGYLHVEACITTQARLAVEQGAEIRIGPAVKSWRAGPRDVTVVTDAGELRADRLIITAGAWSADLLGELGIRLRVLRKPLYWFAARGDAYDAEQGFPAFLYETPTGIFYGFPRIDPDGVKVGRHSGGREIKDPLALNLDIDRDDFETVKQFVTNCLPRATGQLRRHAACMYTMTNDQHFIVDRHPATPRVAFAAGMSGHGFKFAPVIGEALADLALTGRTELPLDFLACRRAALHGG